MMCINFSKMHRGCTLRTSGTSPRGWRHRIRWYGTLTITRIRITELLGKNTYLLSDQVVWTPQDRAYQG